MDPDFAFWPEDLDFFIKFELRDRARRRRLAPGEQRERRVHTTNQYKVHQKGAEIEGWGNFYRVHLVDCCQRRITEETPIKAWGGSPIAALRKAIAVIGCPRSARIPQDAIYKLQILRDLYYGDEDNEAEVEQEYGLDPFAGPHDDIDDIDQSGYDDDKESEDEEENEEEEEEEIVR